MIDSAFMITSFVTLFVIIDPVGLLPVFVALTQGRSDQQRRSIAVRATLTATLILALFALFGESVLNFVGISMPAFRVAGGVLLFLTALDMLFDRRTKRRHSQGEDVDSSEDDPRFFPLPSLWLPVPDRSLRSSCWWGSIRVSMGLPRL